MTDNTPTEKEFYALFINNKDFNAVAQHVNRFNPIRVMNMEHMEIRHSAILVWLLNPNENHRLGDIFLKQFLASAVKNSNEIGETKIPVLDIMTADLNDAIVMSEYQCDGGNIDIVIECPNQNWVFVIENKIHADEGKDQLKRYTSIKKVYSDYKHSFIFLTKEGNFSDCPSEQAKLYHPASHKQVLALLQNIIQIHKDRFSTEISLFIQHYIDTLKEVLEMTDIKLQKKARKLYSKHEKVIDFIMDNKDKTAFRHALPSDLKENKYYNLHENEIFISHINDQQITFLPKKCKYNIEISKEFKETWISWSHGHGFTCILKLEKLNDFSGKLWLLIGFWECQEIDFWNGANDFKKIHEELEKIYNELLAKDKGIDHEYCNKEKNNNTYYSNFSIKIKDVLNMDEIANSIETLFNFYKKIETIITKAINERINPEIIKKK